MTADVIALPGYCLKLVPHLSDADRLDRLRKLAKAADTMDAALVADSVRLYARDDLTDAKRGITWNGYLRSLSFAEDVRRGLIGWEEVNDELTGFDKQETAKEIAAQNAEDALRYLAGVTTTNGGDRDGA